MKILVVDDDRIARKVLRAFLEDARYAVQCVEDGSQAIEVLSGDDAPSIVILDWIMPGMSGPEVCKKLRTLALKTRPYVLMLSAKTDKNEIIAGLDAGADDFVSKPFNLGELLARLRVAQRMVEYDTDLRGKIAELEALEQRHQLLGELLAPNASDAPSAAPAAQVAAAPGPSVISNQILPIACATLEQLGLGKAQPIETPEGVPVPRVSYAAWMAIIAIDEERWIDLVLQGEPADIGRLLEQSLHPRADSSPPKQAFLAETLTVIGSALRNELRQHTCDTVVPFLSRGLYVERPRMQIPLPESAQLHHLALGESRLVFTAIEQPLPLRRKSSSLLRVHDVMAQAHPPPQVNEVALLNRGVILNERYIEKLSAFGDATGEQYPVPVYVPTPLSLYFVQGGRES